MLCTWRQSGWSCQAPKQGTLWCPCSQSASWEQYVWIRRKGTEFQQSINRHQYINITVICISPFNSYQIFQVWKLCAKSIVYADVPDLRIVTVATVRCGRQRLRRGAADRARGWGTHGGRGWSRTAAENQVVPPKTDVGVATAQTVHFLGIDRTAACGYKEQVRILSVEWHQNTELRSRQLSSCSVSEGSSSEGNNHVVL